MNSTVRTILFWLLMILLAVVLWKMASTGGPATTRTSPATRTSSPRCRAATSRTSRSISRRTAPRLQGEYRDGSKFRGVTIANTAIPDVTKALQDKHVLFNYKEVKDANWVSLLFNFAPAHPAGLRSGFS